MNVNTEIRWKWMLKVNIDENEGYVTLSEKKESRPTNSPRTQPKNWNRQFVNEIQNSEKCANNFFLL